MWVHARLFIISRDPFENGIRDVRTGTDTFLIANIDLSSSSSSSLHGPLLGPHPSNTRVTPLVPLDREKISTTTSSSTATEPVVYCAEKYKRSASPRSRAENGRKMDHHVGGRVSGGGLRRKVVEMCGRSTGACSSMWCRSERPSSGDGAAQDNERRPIVPHERALQEGKA